MARSLPRGRSSGANAGDKRKKQIVVVGGVLFVLLLVFQVMRLGGGSATAPPAAVGTEVGSAAGTPAAGAVGSGVGATFATSPASRRALDRMPASDPFVPLIRESDGFSSAEAGSGLVSTESPPATEADTKPAAPASSAGSKEATTPAPVGFTAPEPVVPKASPLPPPTAAVLSINGSSQTVGRSKLFPAKAPAFRLVTVTRKLVRIGVAGGSFTRGRPTITIRRGQSVTLVNTATGVRYLLRFAAPTMASAEPAVVPAPAEEKPAAPEEPAAAPAGEGDN